MSDNKDMSFLSWRVFVFVAFLIASIAIGSFFVAADHVSAKTFYQLYDPVLNEVVEIYDSDIECRLMARQLGKGDCIPFEMNIGDEEDGQEENTTTWKLVRSATGEVLFDGFLDIGMCGDYALELYPGEDVQCVKSDTVITPEPDSNLDGMWNTETDTNSSNESENILDRFRYAITAGEQSSNTSNTQGSSDGYILLEPSIIGQSSDTPTTPSEYLYGIFWFMIGTAGVLAVLVFAIGGIQFMTSGVISQKKDAQEKMTAAIFGLLLALGAWLILNTINPDFVNFDLTLDTVTVTGSGGGTQGVKQTESDGYSSMPIDTVDENGYYAAGKISQERAIREGLAARGIDVVGSQTNEPCEQYRQQGCTDVVGLRKSVFDELDYVVANTDGRITVTGGTEWGHASGTYSHGNGYKVDLRKSANVNAMVADTTLFTRSGTRGDGAPRYINNHTGAEWYDEGDHWDIVTGKP